MPETRIDRPLRDGLSLNLRDLVASQLGVDAELPPRV
jgi:hypothetical protein